MLWPFDLRRRRYLCSVLVRSQQLFQKSPTIHPLWLSSCGEPYRVMEGLLPLPTWLRNRAVFVVRNERIQLRETRGPSFVRAHQVFPLRLGDPAGRGRIRGPGEAVHMREV